MARPIKKIKEQNLNRIQQKIKKLDLEIEEISAEAASVCEQVRNVNNIINVCNIFYVAEYFLLQ